MTGLIPLALNSECPSQRFSVFQPAAEQALRLSFGASKSGPRRRGPPKASLSRLAILPGSPAEWKTALADIKRSYLSSKYKKCLDRCHDILHYTKDLEKIQPAYLVYLRFYAASALEMQARALPKAAPNRIQLLQQARAHYSLASDLTRQADVVSRPARHNHSPVSSYDSAAESDITPSSASTRMSSPSPSFSSVDDNYKPATPPAKPKKRVTFQDVPVIEPIIRPDSPTLGFDDWLGRSSPEPVFPHPILKHDKTPAPALFPPSATPELEADEPCFEDPFYRVRSIHRYRTILSGIQKQITAHLASLDDELAACQDVKANPDQAKAEEGDVDLRARIERLRAAGWQRPRFDGRRYEALRENALADLAA